MKDKTKQDNHPKKPYKQTYQQTKPPKPNRNKCWKC